MFAIMYETEEGKVFKIFHDMGEAQTVAINIACSGIEVTVFDYDKDCDTFVEFYTIREEDKMNYKGFDIDDSVYGMITVQYCGDDLVFDSVEEAERFIDEVTREEED